MKFGTVLQRKLFKYYALQNWQTSESTRSFPIIRSNESSLFLYIKYVRIKKRVLEKVISSIVHGPSDLKVFPMDLWWWAPAHHFCLSNKKTMNNHTNIANLQYYPLQIFPRTEYQPPQRSLERHHQLCLCRHPIIRESICDS
jgi:hypothetical protein